MTNFPGPCDELDHLAFRAAVEAVLGLLSQKSIVNQETVHEWLEVTLGPIDRSRQVRARAMYFADRMFDGPRAPDAAFGPQGRGK